MYDILIWIGFFFVFFTTPQIEVLDIHEIFSTYSSGMKVPRDKLCCGCYSISGAHENVSNGSSMHLHYYIHFLYCPSLEHS